MQPRAFVSVSALLVAFGVASIAEAKNAIQLENERPVDLVKDSWLPDTDPVTWQAVNIGIDGIVDVYPSSWSVQNGEKLGIRISTAASSVRLRIYRLGWYPNSGSGPVGSRLVHEVAALAGEKQPFPPEDAITGLAEAKWHDSYVLSIPDDWVTGHYVIRATTDGGKDAFSYFVLRDDARLDKAPIVYVDTLSTAQAYNPWPKIVDASGKQLSGKSTYDYNSAGVVVKQSGSARAVAVSLDRPYGENWGLGIWRDWTVPTVQWLEMMGLDVGYAVSTDLDAGFVLYGRKLFIDAGHDEYWSGTMWDHLAWARDSGLNLAFFSANDFTWQVRFEPGSGGPKSTMVTYKSAAYPNTVICGDCTGDPEWQAAYAAKLAGDTASQIAHLRNVTYNWSSLADWDPAAKKMVAAPAPVARSGMTIEGLVNGPKTPTCGASPLPTDACLGLPWVVNQSTHWVYTGAGVTGGIATEVKDGDHIPQIVGYEMDDAKVGSTLSTRPSGQIVLASTDKSGWVGQFNAQYYEHASGAKVFSAGTINWPWGLDRPGLGPWGGVDYEAKVGVTTVKAVVSGVTQNVLAKLTDGPVAIPIPAGGIPGAPEPPKKDPPPDAGPIDDAGPETEAPDTATIDAATDTATGDDAIIDTAIDDTTTTDTATADTATADTATTDTATKPTNDGGAHVTPAPADEPRTAPTAATDDTGGCNYGGRSGSPLALLVVVALLARRRR